MYNTKFAPLNPLRGLKKDSDSPYRATASAAPTGGAIQLNCNPLRPRRTEDGECASVLEALAKEMLTI